MFEYRVIKYDPRFRDATGRYHRDEWTAISDIDTAYDSVVLTAQEYGRVEDAYVAAALSFLRESGVTTLTVTSLEKPSESPLRVRDGDAIEVARVGSLIRHVLREDCWCRLEGPHAFVHFGHDYYMFLGVPAACPESRRVAGALGLFVDDVGSPFHPGE